MTGSDPRRVGMERIGLLLAAVMCGLPFVIPYHQQPVLAFFQEWLAVALGVIACGFVAFARTGHAALPAPARWLCALGAWIVVVAAIGRPAYVQLPILALGYVGYAALMMWLGAQLVQRAGAQPVVDTLAISIFVASLVNAAAGVLQIHGLPRSLDNFVAELPAQDWRAIGNIGQANLLANYLSLGLVALLLLWRRQRLHRLAAFAAGAALVWAIALSGSRIALVFALWICASAMAGRRDARTSGTRAIASGAAIAAAAVVLLHAVVPFLLAERGTHGPALQVRLVDAPLSLHLQAWSHALRMSAAAPLFGHGAGEFAGAAWSAGMPPDMAARFGVWSSAHNVLLHWLAETGVPGALIVLAALGTSLCHGARLLRRADASCWALAAWAGIELIHSMTESPLSQAHFLGLAALVIGAGAAMDPPSAQSAGPRRAWPALAIALVLGGLLAALLRDYVRLDATRIAGAGRTVAGAAARSDIATLRSLGNGVLAPVAELWWFLGIALDRSDLPEKLSMSERVMRVWPAPVVAVRRAALLAFDGRADEAISVLEHLPPLRAGAVRQLLEQAAEADHGAIAPLLVRLDEMQRTLGE